ncbi:MAG TPA: hypothetical protein DEH78_10255 [Solibacterales bacterium]|nr:hypothetical protein [Bryobacterales bacterium]
MRFLLPLLCAAALQAQSQAPSRPKAFSILRATLHQFEDGQVMPPGFVWTPGATVQLNFFAAGFKTSPKDEVKVSYRVDAFDPQGVPLMPAITGTVEVELAEEDRKSDWVPKMHAAVPLPPLAETGSYKIVMQAKDEIAQVEARYETPFPVRGRNVEASPTLVMRNFRYVRDEFDRTPMSEPVFKAGDAVWARFEITGYKLGPANRVDVEYGLAVIGPDGKVLYTEPKAATDRDESFYPKKYVLGVLNVTTRPGTTAGEYALLVTVRDNIGGQTYEEKRPFRLE